LNSGFVPQEITAAAAADLQFAMQEIGTRFQQESERR
jgi:hypothetical protein